MTSHERQGFGNKENSAGLTYGAGGPLLDETTARALRIAKRRKWTFIGSIVGVCVAGIGAIFYHNVSSNRQKDVARQYLAIESEYITVTKDFQEKRSKDVAAAAAADPFAMPDYSSVAKKYADFATTHVADPMGWDSALRAAKMYMDVNNIDEARKLLEPLVSRTLKHNLVQIKVRRALAGIYAEKNEFDKAIGELDFIEKLPDNPFIGDVKLFKAQVYFLAGRKDDAAKLMRELATSDSSTTDAMGKPVATEASAWLGYWGL